MIALSKVRQKGRFFYGWWMVVAGTAAWAVHCGVYLDGFSTFFMPLISEFGWSRTALSGAFSLSRFEGSILGPIEGILVDRFGPRRIMVIGITILSLGFILLSRVNSIVMFYVVYLAFMAVGDSLGILTPVPTALGNWFIRKRSTALGVMVSGAGLGAVTVPIIAWLVVQYGWRNAALIIGIATWLLGMPIALVMRHKPEQYGHLPDGDTATAEVTDCPSPKAKGKDRPPEVDFTARQALQTQGFWLLSFAFCMRMVVTGAIPLHFIPFLIGIGISPELAAGMLGALAAASVVGRLGFGWLGDIFDKRYVMAIAFTSLVVGPLLLVVTQNLWQAILFIVVYAPGYGGAITLMPAIRGEYFGRKAFGTIAGYMSLVIMWGTMAGPLFAGYIFDTTGSYRWAFIAFAIAGLIAVVLALMAKRPRLVAKPTATSLV